MIRGTSDSSFSALFLRTSGWVHDYVPTWWLSPEGHPRFREKNKTGTSDNGSGLLSLGYLTLQGL